MAGEEREGPGELYLMRLQRWRRDLGQEGSGSKLLHSPCPIPCRASRARASPCPCPCGGPCGGPWRSRRSPGLSH